MVLHTRRPTRPQLDDARIRPFRMVIHAAVAVTAGVVLALTQAGTGHAEPSPAEIESQIESKWSSIEPVIEQHNKLRLELDATKAKVQQLTEQLRPLQLQVKLSQDKIGKLSANRFKGGNVSTFNAVLTTGSPTSLADQLTTFNWIARGEMLSIKDVVQVKKQYEAEKKPLDALLEQQSRQEASFLSQEKTINAEISDLNALRTKVYPTSGRLTGTRLAKCPVDLIPSDPGSRAAKVACDQIDRPYVWAAEGPSTFDCSGLTKYAWEHADAGVKLRHYTNWQLEDTNRVTKDHIKQGDLLFYWSDVHHVGIYVGDGWMVHAPNSGDVVRMEKFDKFPIAGIGRPSYISYAS